MDLDLVRRDAHPVDAEQASGAPTLRLDRDEDVPGILAYFGADRERAVVRVLVAGEEVGYLARADVRGWIDQAHLGPGDSAGATLPGRVPPGSWPQVELECPVDGCPDSPLVMLGYDEDDPPHCTLHPDERLRRVG
jgi:hypothetical protein